MTNQTKNTRLIQDLEKNLKNQSQLLLQVDKNINSTLITIGKYFGFDSLEYSEALRIIYKNIPKSKIRQHMVVPYFKLETCYSHIESQVNNMRFKQELIKQSLNLSPWNNDKSIDQKFASSIGLSTPKLLQEKIKFREIDFKKNTVIKPEYGASSKNVFLVYNSDNIIEIKGHKKYSQESLMTFLAQKEKEFENSLWNVEKLILNKNNLPAHDIKLYTYYGKVGAVLEIKRNQEGISHCWYDNEGRVLNKKKQYIEPSIQWFEGHGFNSHLISIAEKLSLEMPVPFMRIDFLAGSDDYYLGELTPHPGKYYPYFNPELDEYLGKLFLEAEAKLFKDLLENKKDFHKYLTFYNQ